jgi:hypothetical protein
MMGVRFPLPALKKIKNYIIGYLIICKERGGFEPPEP